MTLRTWRQLLLAVDAVLLVGIIASVAAFVLVPVEEGSLPTAADPASKATAAPPTGEPKPLSHYAVIHQRDLLKPLYDPEPVKVATVAPPPPKLAVKLEGTAVEPGFTYGLFRAADGKVKLVSVGQTIEGAEVLAITSGEARLRHHGREVILKVERAEKGGRR